MARITFSPLVSSVRNKIGDIVFSVWKGIPYVRTRVIPANPQSDLQTAQRLTFTQCVAIWQDLVTTAAHLIRANWERFAEGYALSGFNRFVSIGSKEEAAGNLVMIAPTNVLVPKIGTLAAATGASGVITVTWDATDMPVNSMIQMWYRLPEEVSIHYHGEVAVATETYDLDGVTADTEFCVYAFVEDTAQELEKDYLGESDMKTATSGA